MGREIRKVPANWEHPKKDNGGYQPLYKEYYEDAFNEWLDNHNKWADGTHADLKEHPEYKSDYPFYAMYGGNPPDVEYYQTRKYNEDELTHIQLYENTSEGTPLSPVFRADEFENLCEWAAENASTFADHKASKEDWMKMLSDGLVFHQEGNVIWI